MKRLMIILAMIFSIQTDAHSGVVCTSTRVADTGYELVFSNNFASVIVNEISIAGAMRIANLVCSPSENELIYHCFEPKLRDAGYSVTLFGLDACGQRYATIQEVFITGSAYLDTLSCK